MNVRECGTCVGEVLWVYLRVRNVGISESEKCGCI